MRLHVATKEGTVTVDVPQEATSRDLTSRVLASASQEGTSPTEAARHYLVRTCVPTSAFHVQAADSEPSTMGVVPT